MDEPPTRRHLLKTGGAALVVGLAGCAGDAVESSPTATATPTPTPTETSDAGYPDVDERVDRLPPGSPALSPAGEWPSYRFDAGNTGANPAGTGLRNGTEYWRLNAGGPASVANGRLSNVFSRDQSPKQLTIRDPATAAIDRQTPLVGYGVTSPPTIADGRVFVTTFIEVFCLDAETGEELWRGPEMDGIQGRPTVHDGVVFVNSGGFDGVEPQLRAFDAETGNEQWRYDVGAETKSTPAVAGDRVLVTGAGGVHAVDRASGDQAFVVPDVASRWGDPVVADGVCYAIDDGEESQDVVAINIDSRETLWRRAADTDSPPVVAGDRIYLGSDGQVRELDATDGSVRRSSGGPGQPVALVGDVLYVTNNGAVRALDLAGDLAELWSLRTEEVQISDTIGRAVYSVTPVDGAVYVSARDAFYGIGPAESA